MKNLIVVLLTFSSISSFAQIGTFKKVETDNLRLRTMLNSDIQKFLTTDANGHVILETVSVGSGGGTGGRFGIEDNTTPSDTYRAIDLKHNGINLFNADEILLDAASGSKLAGYNAIISTYFEGTTHEPYTDLYNQNSAGQSIALYLFNAAFKYKINNVNNYLPLTVNGIHADASGNVTLTSADIAGLQNNQNTFASYNTQLNKLAPKFTPKSSKDKRGIEGRVTYDNSYAYIKTDNGWRRFKLSKF